MPTIHFFQKLLKTRFDKWSGNTRTRLYTRSVVVWSMTKVKLIKVYLVDFLTIFSIYQSAYVFDASLVASCIYIIVARCSHIVFRNLQIDPWYGFLSNDTNELIWWMITHLFYSIIWARPYRYFIKLFKIIIICGQIIINIC